MPKEVNNTKNKKMKKFYEKYKEDVKNNSRKALSNQISERSIIYNISLDMNINFETCRSYVRYDKMKKENNDKNHGNQLLTNSQEQQLLGVIQSFQTHGNTLRRCEVIELARESFNLEEKWKGSKWFSNFTNRYNLSSSKEEKKKISRDRINPDIRQHCITFGKFWRKLLQEKRYSENQIFNVDETLIDVQKVSNNSKKVISLGVPNVQGKYSSKFVISMVPFVGADGTVLLIAYIVPSEFDENGDVIVPLELKNPGISLRGDVPKYYGFSKTGFVTKELWISIFEEFLKIKMLKMENKEMVLTMDRLVSHIDPTCLLKGYHANVNCVYFPAHSSHFLQPLDDKIFGNLKKFLETLILEKYWVRKNSNSGVNNLVNDVFPKLEEKSLTTKIIKASFRDTGIFPPNPNLILENSKKYLYDPAKIPKNLTDRIEKKIDNIFKEKNPKKKRNSAPIVAERNKCYSTSDFLNLHQKQTEKFEKIEQEKIQKKEQREKNKLEKEFLKQRKKAEIEKKKKEKLKKDEEKKNKQISNTCQVCSKKYTVSQTWVGCEYCDIFWVCEECHDATQQVEKHENSCGKKKNK